MPNPASGIHSQVFMKAEATYDTAQSVAATDAISPVRGSIKFEPNLEFEKSKEACGTASLQTENQQNQGGRWSLQTYCKPAAAGTAPDIGVAGLLAAFGKATNTPATSEVYSLYASDTSITSLQIVNSLSNENFQEGCTGAWVEELGIEIVGNQNPIFSFSGGYASHYWAYETVIGVGGVGVAGTTCPLDAADDGMFEVGALVQIGADDNGSAGFRITAVDHSTPNFTFTPAEGGTGQAAGLAVKPFVPSQTTGGSILSAVQGTLTVDEGGGSVTLGYISCKINIQTGIHGLDREATTDRPNRLAKGDRVVEGEIVFYFLDSPTGNAPFLGRAWQGDTIDLDIRVGPNTAGSRMKISVPKCRFAVAPVDVPEAEELTYTMNFIARQNAAADDEITLTFD